MNKNNGKLLAAVIAMLMVVCAVAVVAMPAEAADAEPPAADFDGVTAKDIDDVADITALTGDDASYDSTNKILTINNPVILNIIKDVTISDLRIVLNADLKITGTGALDITATSKTGATAAYTITFNADDAVLCIDGAKVTLDVDETRGSVFNNMYPGVTGAVQVVNKAVLTVNHTNGGSTWLEAPAQNDKTAWLIVNDATVNFEGTKAVQQVIVDADKADINFTNVLIGPSILAGSDFNASSMSVTGADLNGIFVKGDIALKNGSSFEVSGASGTNADRPGLMISNSSEVTITMDDTSGINVDTIGLTDNYNGYSSAQNNVNIVGGKISGTFTPVKTAANRVAETQPEYTLAGTTVTGNSTVDTGAVLASGVSGDNNGFTVDGNLRNKGTVNTASAPIEVTGKFTNTADGTVSGAKPITGSGTVTNDGTMNAPVEAPGYTDNNASDLTVFGDSTGTQWYPSKQNITVPAGETWTIIKDNYIVIPGTLTVEGNLVIEEGGVLVVGGANNTDTSRNDYGTATVQGKLTVEEGATFAVAYGVANIEGEAVIDGTVMVGYGYTGGDDGEAIKFNSKIDPENPPVLSAIGQKAELNFENNATFSETSVLNQGAEATSKITVAADYTLTLEGQFGDDVYLSNSGFVVIDSEPAVGTEGAVVPCANNIKVYMLADGASVDIQNLAMTSDATVEISDKGLVTDAKKNTVVTDDDETRVKFSLLLNTGVTSITGGVISGITVVENFDGVKKETEIEAGEDATMNSMEVSGTVTTSEIVEADKDKFKARVALVEGDFTVSDSLSIGENVSFELSNAIAGVALDVSGYVPVNADGAFVNNAEVTVSGEGHIYLAGKDITGSGDVNAAYYNTTVEAVKYSNYVTVDTAIAAANADSTIKEIQLYGENTLTASATLPAIDFTFVNGAELTVGSTEDRTITLTVTAGADYNGTGTTDVLGTVFFEDKSDLRSSVEMISDVYTEEPAAEGEKNPPKDGWARSTNIYTAMAEANAGETITIYKTTGYVDLTSDFTVKEGVTLVVPDTTNYGLRIMDGVTLTVAGTLVSEKDAGIVAEHRYAAKATTEKNKESSAVVVTGTLKTVDTIAYAGTFNAAAANSPLSSGSYISGAYYVDDENYNYVTTVAKATSADVVPAIDKKITINGTVAEGDITFAAAEFCTTIAIGAGAQVTLSSLTLSNEAVLTSAADGVFTGTVTVGDASIQAVKVKALNVESAAGLTVTGANVNFTQEGVEGNQAKLNASAGTVIVKSVTGDLTVDAGATLTVPATTETVKNTRGSVSGKLFVDGTVTLVSGQKLEVASLFVDGTVNVAAAEGTNTGATLDVTGGYMFVGLDDKFAVTSSTAAVNGTVGCDYIYAAAGTTVTMDEKVFTKSTQYFVEDALWMTAYANAEANALPIKGADDTAAATIKAAVPVENAWFNGTWLEEDGTEIGAAGANNSNVGDVDAVYAKVVYDIYVINLKADQNAISSITIDGSVMSYGMIAEKDPVTGEINYYYGYTAVVDAGAHTIQYQLANGYSGNGVLTVNGEQQSGLTFTTEGTPTAEPGKIRLRRLRNDDHRLPADRPRRPHHRHGHHRGHEAHEELKPNIPST